MSQNVAVVLLFLPAIRADALNSLRRLAEQRSRPEQHPIIAEIDLDSLQTCVHYSDW